jgi:hypothetical protein
MKNRDYTDVIARMGTIDNNFSIDDYKDGQQYG